MIYTAGAIVVIKSVEGLKDQYLRGHTAVINCLAVSKKGNLVASGERRELNSNELGALIVWNFYSLEILYRVRFHK